MTMDEEMGALIVRHEDIRKKELELKVEAGRFQEDIVKFMSNHFGISGEISIMEIIKKVRAKT